jgi:hypothetical protein
MACKIPRAMPLGYGAFGRWPKEMVFAWQVSRSQARCMLGALAGTRRHSQVTNRVSPERDGLEKWREQIGVIRMVFDIEDQRPRHRAPPSYRASRLWFYSLVYSTAGFLQSRS